MCRVVMGSRDAAPEHFPGLWQGREGRQRHRVGLNVRSNGGHDDEACKSHRPSPSLSTPQETSHRGGRREAGRAAGKSECKSAAALRPIQHSFKNYMHIK